MEKEELIFVKRKSNGLLRTNDKPLIKVDFKKGRISITQKTAEILKVDNNDGLMFAFNKKEGKGYVIKDNEPDAFKVLRKSPYELRFTSKDLAEYFEDVFKIEDYDKTIMFKIEAKPNKKGFYEIIK